MGEKTSGVHQYFPIWAVTRKALGRDSGGWIFIDPVTE